MKFGTPLVLLLASLAPAWSQPSALNCVAASSVPLVRAEGVTERIGDIVLNCTGAAGATIRGNMTLFLSADVTNRIGADNTLDAQLTVDTGAGPSSSGVKPQLLASNQVAFPGFSFTVPASRAVSLRISNVRVRVAQPPSGDANSIQAFLSLDTGAIGNSQFSVALPRTGLLAAYASGGVSCYGSALPASNLVSVLLNSGASLASTRVTEGFAEAFQKRGAFTDTGTRVMVRYSGFPAGAHLLVPDVVTGSTALEPTSGGDLGLPASGGKYAPTDQGSLLLARVFQTDANGSGGTPVYLPGAPGSGPVSFDAASEVPLTGGAGMAVYEVVDANSSVRESAQFPTFLGIPAAHNGQTIVAHVDVSWGPISDAPQASVTAPIPRFASFTPPSDCQSLGDCDASYFPHFSVDAPAFDFAAASGGNRQTKYMGVYNQGAGVLEWHISTTYKSGDGWLAVSPTSGFNTATVRVDALPAKLAQGTYQAVLTVDAGPLAGTRSFDVRFVVTPPAPPTPSRPVIGGVANAASFAAGPLVAGSLATIMGSHLAGTAVAVTFDSVPAQILFSNDAQINLRVPPALASGKTPQVVVTVDGSSSLPFAVTLADAAPGIFANGILNQDNSVNSAASPAPAGSIIQIFATGLLSPEVVGVIACIADRNIAFPAYFGPAPASIGVQQVNLAIPADLPAMTTQVFICSLAAARPESPICSPPAPLVIGGK